MGFRFRKSFNLGGGARLNLSRRGVGASWGAGGFRVRLSPGRGGGSSSGTGCFPVLAAVVALALVFWVVTLLIAVFSTPYPYILLVAVGAFHGVRAVRRQRLEKLYFDAIASLHGDPSIPRERVDELWERGKAHPDVLLLRAAYLASHGRHAEAVEVFNTIAADQKGVGTLSGGLSLWFPGLIEPVWFAAGGAFPANLALVAAHEAGLAGFPTALATLERRLHEPHLAAALGAVTDAYTRQGRHDRAAAAIHHYLGQVRSPELQAELRYRLAGLLERGGSKFAAFQTLRDLGPHRDAAERANALERELVEEGRRNEAHRKAVEAEQLRQRLVARERAIAAEDERVRLETLDRIAAQRGPKTRRRALDWGLERIQQPHVREQLLLAASQLEVDAVLDKVATLKTKAAKRRNLEEAIANLQSDEVDDRLQHHELTMLERELDRLEGEA